MSVKLRFDCPSDGGVVQRSRSFTGFSSLTGRRRSSSTRTSLRSTALVGGKSPRLHLSPSRVGGAIWSQQPEQVDRIFQALRKGLKQYLETHQAEMDFLSSQQRETKRNSRLAFLYDLEKEIRAVERYIRRLEFHISKVEELYETYCIQWRLCQGAINMKRAFSLSPSSRASRDSLLELHRNHRHSLEDMSAMEGQLEILLGELQIKMKGLIGFARLCPGDQYEVVVRLGRQRWRVRGKIQTDDRQSWEEEEMVFLPHIHHNFQIKVMEAKGLGWLLVGMVTCESAGFFVARPQLMVVDITELGTIKLQLEVTWNPFDIENKMAVSASRHSVSSRKASYYSWTAPSTPSFTEKYFISMVHQLQEPEDSFSTLVSRARGSRGGVSLLSYLADPAHSSLSPISTEYSQSLTQTSSYCSLLPAASQDASLEDRHTLLSLEDSLAERGRTGEEEEEEEEEEEWRGVSDPSPTPGQRDTDSPMDPQRSSTPDILRQNGGGGLEPGPAPGRAPHGRQDPASRPVIPPDSAPDCLAVSGPQRGALALRVGTLLAELENSFTNRSEKELRALDNQILHLGTILKNDLSLMKTTSEETLAVEEVLGSFDFLSHDFSPDDDTSCLGSLRLKDTGMGSFQQNTLRSLGLLTLDSQSVSEEGPLNAPLTSGNWSMDQVLETHLDLCCILLKALGTVDCPLSQRELLDEVSLQANVLDRISHLLLERNDCISASNILPKAQRTKDVLSFWEECTKDSGSPFCCHANTFSRSLRKRYTHKVKAKQPGQSEKVFSELRQAVQTVCRMVPSPSAPCSPDRVSVFQLSCYLNRWGVQDLGEHVSRLSREVYLLSALASPKRRRALKKLRGRSFSELLPLGRTLQTLAALQIDSNHKVCKAAANCLVRGATCRAFRNKAVVYYTESLKQGDVQIQQASCLALKCLRATESVEQIADLWKSTDEDLRGAAREAVLSFGKKGYLAFQRMDQLTAELQEEAYQNQDTEITIL